MAALSWTALEKMTERKPLATLFISETIESGSIMLHGLLPPESSYASIYHRPNSLTKMPAVPV